MNLPGSASYDPRKVRVAKIMKVHGGELHAHKARECVAGDLVSYYFDDMRPMGH